MTFSQAVKALEEAGFNQEQARAVAEAVSESVTTKADPLEPELRVGEKSVAKLDAFAKKLDAFAEKIDTKFDALNNRILIGTLSIIAALFAATAGGVFTLVQLLK